MVLVHALPETLAGHDLAGSTAVVIDVLRATTTISRALASGARQLYICQQTDDALAKAAGMSPPPLLGGERQGLRIEGFDLGNSPAEYTAEKVAGKDIVFTTTNGTRAMAAARDAEQILLGSFVNLSALLACLAEANGALHLVCAGTNGEETAEDLLCAGALVEQRQERGDLPANDDACRALELWQSVKSGDLCQQLVLSRGGQNLVACGLAADIGLASHLDAWPVVGRYDPACGTVVRM